MWLMRSSKEALQESGSGGGHLGGALRRRYKFSIEQPPPPIKMEPTWTPPPSASFSLNFSLACLNCSFNCCNCLSLPLASSWVIFISCSRRSISCCWWSSSALYFESSPAGAAAGGWFWSALICWRSCWVCASYLRGSSESSFCGNYENRIHAMAECQIFSTDFEF